MVAGVLQDAYVKRRLRVLSETSASQLDQWEQCPRKWFNAYVVGDRQPQTDAQKRGVDIDDNYVQPYLKTGVIRTTGKWAKLLAQLVPLLPKPGPRDNLIVQARIEFPTYEGGPVVGGWADWLEEVNAGELDIGDLKSTSDFRYCKTPQQLVDNTQMITYAKYGYSVLKARRVHLSHVYGRTRGAAKAHRTPALTDRLLVTADEVDERWGHRLDIIKDMTAATRSCASAEDLPPTVASCGLYGGCHYRAKCGIDAHVTVGSLFTKIKKGKTMADQSRLLDMLRAKNAGLPQPAPEVARPVEVSPPPPPDARPSLFASKKAPAGPPAGVDGYKPGQLCNGRGYYASSNGQGFMNVEPGHKCSNCPVAIAPDQVVPPEMVDKRTTTADEVKVAEETKRKPGRPKKEAPSMKISVECETCGEKVPSDSYEEHKTAHAATPVEAPPADDAAVLEALLLAGFTEPEIETLIETETVEQALAGQILPKSRQASPPVPAKEAPKVAALSRALVKEMAKPDKPDKPVVKAPKVRPLILVDSLPTKGKGTMLEEWIAPMTEMVAAANDVSDIRLLSYSAAKGGLATAMRECIDTVPEVLLIDSRSADAALALEVLAPYAADVYRGVR